MEIASNVIGASAMDWIFWWLSDILCAPTICPSSSTLTFENSLFSSFGIGLYSFIISKTVFKLNSGPRMFCRKQRDRSNRPEKTGASSVTYLSSLELLPGNSLIWSAWLRSDMSPTLLQTWSPPCKHHSSLFSSSRKTNPELWERYCLSTRQICLLFSEAAVYAVFVIWFKKRK